MNARKSPSPNLTRRGALGGLLAACGGLVVRSLATGIPATVLLDPQSARASDGVARTLILSVSDSGDPVNIYTPGSFASGGSPKRLTDGVFAPVPIYGDQQGAAVWQDVLSEAIDEAIFFHHATHTPVHGEMKLVQRLMGQSADDEMLLSHIARELATKRSYLQTEPLSLGASGGELLSFEGRLLGNVTPTSVRLGLVGPDTPLLDDAKGLRALRDSAIDALYGLYKEDGTPKQLELLDRWASARDQVRAIDPTLVDALMSVEDDEVASQVTVAAALAEIDVAPVITVSLDFGGDNHNDAGFEQEAERYPLGVAELARLYELSRPHGAMVASLNVFGRTFHRTDGRDHNRDHHVTVMLGEHLAGGVVGGVEPTPSGDYKATAIEQIPFEETLASMGKTLGVAAGVAAERMDELVAGGAAIDVFG